MLALEFFTWWYGQGWMGRWRGISDYSKKLLQFFSLSVLIKTLFEPWRRIISYPGAGIDNIIRAKLDNLFSRGVGLVVRLLVIFIASLSLLIIILLGTVLAIVWPLFPLAAVVLVIKGLI